MDASGRGQRSGGGVTVHEHELAGGIDSSAYEGTGVSGTGAYDRYVVSRFEGQAVAGAAGDREGLFGADDRGYSYRGEGDIEAEDR